MNLPQCSDLRGFDWPLAPLQQKLAWERDAARGRLAAALRSMRRGLDARSLLEKACTEQAGALAAAARHAPHPQAHVQALHYLAGLQARAAQAAARLRQLEELVAVARRECADRERKLEAMLAVRRSALRSHLRRQGARQAREADLAWLVHAHAQRARAGEG